MTDAKSPPRVYLDTNVFIFAFEGDVAVSERVKPLVDAFRSHPGSVVTSELTLAEVLAESARPRSPILKRLYLDFIIWSGIVDLVPIGRNILFDSVDLRSVHKSAHGRKLELPDAIHLATAIQKKCHYFISADEGINPPVEMKGLSPLSSDLDEVLRAFP